jgi:phosphomannomutase
MMKSNGKDTTDGIRVLIDNGDVAPVRPSGNADELRIYSVADTRSAPTRSRAMGIAEPNGVLRCTQKRSPSIHEIGVLAGY